MARIAQRLVAAGASPERARAFEQQFVASRPGLKPQEIQDAFDDQLAAFSAAQYPYTFKPQSLSDAELPDYIIATYGPQRWNDLTKSASPFYNSALNSNNIVIKTIAEDAKNGVALADTIATIRQLALSDPNTLGGLTEADAVSQANKIFADFDRAANAAKGFLKTDKYYKANLPHPNLKYGVNTDLKAGTIDFRTNPGVKKVLKGIQEAQAVPPASFVPGTRTADVLERRAIAAGRQVSPEDVFKSFEKTKSTPFFDEVKRREFLKGKTTLP